MKVGIISDSHDDVNNINKAIEIRIKLTGHTNFNRHRFEQSGVIIDKFEFKHFGKTHI